MTTAVQRRRGTTTEHASFTGLEGEISVNTTKDTLVVHDGSTAGGFELARADGSNFVASTVDINGGTIDGTTIGASSASTGAFTTLTATGEITANGGIALGDNDKATFGASDDLQIYHDGSSSFIKDAGTGNLIIQATDLQIANADNTANYIRAFNGGAVDLRYAGSAKLATTSTGIDVTGTATMDGLVVDSTTSFSWLPVSTAGSVVGTIGTGSSVIFNTPSVNSSYGSGLAIDGSYASDLSSINIKAFGANFNSYGSELNLFTSDDTSLLKRQTIASNGDISFYEDTGTTAKLFWDASAESLGIGTSSPATDLHIKNAGSTQVLLESGNTDTGFLLFGDAQDSNIGSVSYNHSDNSMRFETDDSERMRIDSSGNVGIGTDSPDSKLDVSRGSSGEIARFTSPNGTNSYITIGRDGSTSEGFTAGYNSSNGDCTLTAIAATHPIIFKQSTTERMRIDSSGNLLVGKTSNTISAAGAKLGTGGSNFTRSGEEVVYFNRTTNDGNIATFAKDGTTVGSIGVASEYLYINGTRSTDAGLMLGSQTVAPASSSGANRNNEIDLGFSGNSFKDLYLSGGVSTNTATGLSITADSSNRGILNLSTSTAYQLIGGSYYGYTGYKTGGYHRWFGSDGSEDMRIDSSGNLLVSVTSITDATSRSFGNAFSGSGTYANWTSWGNGTGHTHASFRNATNVVGTISTTASATTYNTSSDERLKENITDANDAGDKIDAIKVRQYDWKADGSHQDYGMIAQELLEVAPEVVSVPEDSEEMMGVDYSKLVPMLIKEIQSLRNRVAQLEGI